jgi:hypothetical protein
MLHTPPDSDRARDAPGWRTTSTTRSLNEYSCHPGLDMRWCIFQCSSANPCHAPLVFCSNLPKIINTRTHPPPSVLIDIAICRRFPAMLNECDQATVCWLHLLTETRCICGFREGGAATHLHPPIRCPENNRITNYSFSLLEDPNVMSPYV